MNEYDQSIADVIRRTLHDAQDLIRGEIALAKAELRQEVRRVGVGMAALAGAAVAGVIGILFLLAAIAWAIPAVAGWPAWTGFAIVAGVVLVAAAVLAAMGKKRFNGERHMPLTVETLKENMEWTRARKP
jgi:protein-S-isoprenylcysteine O-methyltransferase Ste14